MRKPLKDDEYAGDTALTPEQVDDLIQALFGFRIALRNRVLEFGERMTYGDREWNFYYGDLVRQTQNLVAEMEQFYHFYISRVKNPKVFRESADT